MVGAIFKGLLSFGLFFVKAIGNLVILPIQWALVGLSPDVASFFSTIMTFFDNEVFPIISWFKISILNITCCPPEVWNLFILTLTTFFIFAPVFRSLRLLYNIYKVWKGTQT